MKMTPEDIANRCMDLREFTYDCIRERAGSHYTGCYPLKEMDDDGDDMIITVDSMEGLLEALKGFDLGG